MPIKEGYVKLADVSPETRDKVHIFTREQRIAYPDKKIKTLEEGILFAMEQAEKVPGLEARIKELEEKLGI